MTEHEKRKFIRRGRTDIARINGKPAHEAFKGRVTQSMIDEHGSYRAAKAALESRECEQ